VSTKFCSCVKNLLYITQTYFINITDILVLFYTPRVTFRRCLENQDVWNWKIAMYMLKLITLSCEDWSIMWLSCGII